MNKFYINKSTGQFTAIKTDEEDLVRIPQGWEYYQGSMEDAEVNNLKFVGYKNAGFHIRLYGTWRETSH